jgi:hypothetical protein
VLITSLQPLRGHDPNAASLVLALSLPLGLCCIGGLDELDAMGERVAEEDGKTHRSSEASPLL